MSESNILITLPFSKTYFSTFLNSFIQIHFYNDNSFTQESLRNLLFPPEYSDKDFNNLVDFVKHSMDETIKNNKDLTSLKADLSRRFSFEDDLLKSLVNIVNSKRTEILNHLNLKFNSGKKIFQNDNWSIKSILSANKDDHYVDKYCDIEIVHKSRDNNLNVLGHTNISFNKGDIKTIFSELKKIKENLKKIKEVNN
jgi:hypothetical protein